MRMWIEGDTMQKAKQILHLTLPLILQQLCLQMQLWIDRAMLGHVNADFFAAIGNTSVPYHMVSSTITAVCGGTAIVVAQGIGAKDLRRVRDAAGASLLGSGVLSGVTFLIFLLGCEGILDLMGVARSILDYSTTYLKILSLSLLFLGPAATATGILQGIGATGVIMATGIAGNLVNIVLDWILIFGKLGFPALGIQGAALATVTANGLSAILAVCYLLCSKSIPFRIRLPRSGADVWQHYRQVLLLGTPSGLEYALWNVGNVMLVSFLNRWDGMAAGIYTLVFSVETVPLLIYMGFANAGLTLVGQETGARSHKQARRTGLLCLGFSLAVCVIIGSVFCAFPRQLLGLFTDDGEILDTAVPYLMFVCWILFPKAVNNVIGLCIRGMGDTRWMLLTQIFGTVFMIGAGYYLILYTGRGLFGIFLTMILDEAIRGCANLLRFLWPVKRSYSI